MKCFRCKKDIGSFEEYYGISEFRNRKKIKTDYVHKTCWDKFLNDINNASSSLKKSNFLLDAMGKHMKSIGMIKEKEVEYVC